MTYFLIYSSEDGISVTPYKKDDLLEVLKENREYYEYVSDLSEHDPEYWEGNVLIIKGEIITPKPIKVVEEYEV